MTMTAKTRAEKSAAAMWADDQASKWAGMGIERVDEGSAALALTVEGLPPQSLSMPALGALVYLGLFPTGIAYIMRFALIRAIGYSRFSLSINLVPVFGVALGVVLLGEQVSLNLIAALALVLAGLVVGSGGRKIQPASL